MHHELFYVEDSSGPHAVRKRKRKQISSPNILTGDIQMNPW